MPASSAILLNIARAFTVGACDRAVGTVQAIADSFGSESPTMPSGRYEGVKGTRIKRCLNDPLAALVKVTGNDQHVAASLRQGADFSGVVTLAVFMGANRW
jgi:hypothetical protein